MTPIKKVLIANRGEIAVRLIRGCREQGIAAVAVYSDADREALHVRLADEAYHIGAAPAAESYLRAAGIVAAALQSRADAIHPGYGFLSERAHFARACVEAGIIFIGPSAEAIELLGSKIAAKRLAIANDVPVVPGYDGADQTPTVLQAEAHRIGFPLLIKASAGGGGKGMRVVAYGAEFPDALAGAQREARAAFGDDTVLLEKLIERPRHVEFQILADHHGHVVHLHERECSIQRRHQKILEEAPCVALSSALRAEMGAAAVRLARAAGYRNAGTVEFMLDGDGRYYFLEMNTRLQVEHPVTELVTGYDLVHLQLAIAEGEPLPFAQEEVRAQGHAIETRVYAEDPVTFLPMSGPVYVLQAPEGPGIRNDLGLAGGDEIPVHYDPMVAKLTVYGSDRLQAIRRLQRALDEYAVLGLTTNLALLRAIAAHPAFKAGDTHTSFLDDAALTADLSVRSVPAEVLVAATFVRPRHEGPGFDPFARIWRRSGASRPVSFVFDGQTHTVSMVDDSDGCVATIGDELFHVELVARRGSELTLRFATGQERFFVAEVDRILYLQWRGGHWRLLRHTGLTVETVASASEGLPGHAELEAPMSGTIVKILVSEGQHVVAHEPLVVLEAMKMEHTIVAPAPGVVSRLPYDVGQLVSGGSIVIELDPEPEAS